MSRTGQRSHQDPPPVIIYQMGKVGSTALARALKASDVFAVQVHSLHPTKIEKTKAALKKAGTGIPAHVHMSKRLIDLYLRAGVPLRIITPIRRPVDRNVSAFFQALPTDLFIEEDLQKILPLPYRLLQTLPLPHEWRGAIVQRLIRSRIVDNIPALVQYFKQSYRHRLPLDWFDEELKPSIDIDVYESDFDPNRGWQVYRGRHIDLLVYQSELEDKEKTRVVSTFLDRDICPITRAHTSDQKGYKRAMTSFKKHMLADETYGDRMKGSKYVRWFYGKE